MSLMISTESPRLTTAAGVIRGGVTRVSLDSVVFAFLDGSTPEEIAQQYPTLNLADVYGAVTYYLNHRDEVTAYLRDRQTQREQIRKEVEGRFDPTGLRDRLLAMRPTS